KNDYLETMKGSDICIGSTGLHGSIGWKTGEYVAASRAIINEKFNYEVTGDFEIGKNYFDFDSVDGCMAHVEKLFSDPDLVYQIKVNNRNYYQNYLRPDVQAANSLKAAGVDI
ncbi:MAG: glycosyltransferase family 1 protein, partial [Clostridiaceae bacterium]|nr:glycosyltransferase family 1 protein [Clostridiaceae bacterium]